MIECRGQPGVGGVTTAANLAKVIRRVIRVSGALIISLMTGKAGRRCIDVPCHMASDAISHCMLAGQSESYHVVIKRGGRPTVSRMTVAAVLAEIALNMVRVFGLHKIGLMTGIAGRWRIHIPG